MFINVVVILVQLLFITINIENKKFLYICISLLIVKDNWNI